MPSGPSFDGIYAFLLLSAIGRPEPRFFGTSPCPETTKKLWDYIKANNLQDPNNKRLICPDAKLAKVLGDEPIDMMKMAGKLSKHFK